MPAVPRDPFSLVQPEDLPADAVHLPELSTPSADPSAETGPDAEFDAFEDSDLSVPQLVGPAGETTTMRRGARSKARRRALDVLYEAEMRKRPALDILADKELRAPEPLNPYTRVLVEGVLSRQAVLDEQIGENAQDWDLDRMAAVDRNILRLGAYELLWGGKVDDAVPEHVAISEAVSLAEELSTDASAKFVNGLLGRLQDLKPLLLDEHGDNLD